MSGGSYEYLCFKLEEAGENITQRNNHQTTRQIISKFLNGLGKIMYEVEWEDSGDGGSWEKVDKELKKILDLSKINLGKVEKLQKYEMIEKIVHEKLNE